MIEWKSMHVNSKRALEMELKSYKYPAHITMIQEIIANAQDAFTEHNTKNPTVDINFRIYGSDKYIIFHNNSEPIPEKFFDKKYQTLFESSKTVGDNIGFVGIGAKIFLPSHKNAEIITITGKSKKLVTKWKWTDQGAQYVTNKKYLISDIVDLRKFPHEDGTTFICKLASEQYQELQKDIEKIIHFWWNYAIITKLFTIKINGTILEPKFPSKVKHFSKSTTIHSQKIKIFFYISDEELDDDFQNIIYTVHGKRIENEKIDTVLSIKNNFGARIFCYADVTFMASFVLKSKEGFEKNRNVTKIRNKIRNKFWDFIKEQGLYKDRVKDATKNVELEKLTDKLNTMLQSNEFKDLNPFLAKRPRETIGSDKDGDKPISETPGSQESGGGKGTDNPTIFGQEQGTGIILDPKGDGQGKIKIRNTRGISISEIEHDETEKMEAYVSEKDKAVIINIGHPFYKKINGTYIAEFHKYRIVIEALVRYQVDAENWDANMAFDKTRDLLHSTYD